MAAIPKSSQMFFVTFEGKEQFVKESDLVNLQVQAYRECSEIYLSYWRGQINRSKSPRRKDGTLRPHYKDSLTFKILRWSNGKGCSIIFGPRSYSAPHAHLVEDGTTGRSRKPYLRAATGLGHGIRGRYEFVNFKGSSRHAQRPPYPAGHPILTTGSSAARKWKQQTNASALPKFVSESHELFVQKIRDFLRSSK